MKCEERLLFREVQVCMIREEISFLSQCREGETLLVRSKTDGNTVYLAAAHDDGKLVDES